MALMVRQLKIKPMGDKKMATIKQFEDDKAMNHELFSFFLADVEKTSRNDETITVALKNENRRLEVLVSYYPLADVFGYAIFQKKLNEKFVVLRTAEFPKEEISELKNYIAKQLLTF